MTEIGGKPPMKMFVSRAKAGGIALLLVGWAALLVWMLNESSPHFGIYAWAFQQPVKPVLYVPLAALALGALLFLYWTVTPLPYLYLDEAGLTFRRLPFVKRKVLWADVDAIIAVRNSRRDYAWTLVWLTLWVSPKPQAVDAYGGKPAVKLEVPQYLLSMPVEDVVRHLERYHVVTFSDNRTLGAV